MLKSEFSVAFCLKAICYLLISCPDIDNFWILIDYKCGNYHVCTLSNIFSFSSLVFIPCGCLSVTFPFLCLTWLSCVKDRSLTCCARKASRDCSQRDIPVKCDVCCFVPRQYRTALYTPLLQSAPFFCEGCCPGYIVLRLAHLINSPHFWFIHWLWIICINSSWLEIMEMNMLLKQLQQC